MTNDCCELLSNFVVLRLITTVNGEELSDEEL